MSNIYVNDKDTDANGTETGYAVDVETTVEDMRIIFPGNSINNINSLMKQGTAFYFFMRHCQYVVYFSYDPGMGISITFTDFKGDWDNALDRYTALQEKEWGQPDRDKIMAVFEEIQNDETEYEKAEMVIRPLEG